jgi:uncharacterized protein
MTEPYQETALLLHCEGDRLVAVLSQPPEGAGARDTGVVIVVGGPQVRAGSHRQFVQQARVLSAQGWPVLRFDVRGMGDSTGSLRNFENLTPDIGAAVDALLARCPHVRHVVLWGLCDGASAALLYLYERADTRVSGLCLLNPWVRSAASLARTHVKHYYWRRLLQQEFWRKLVRGGVALAAIRGLLSNLRAARSRADPGDADSFQRRMAQAWSRHAGAILLALSGNDHTAQEFLEYSRTDSAWSGLLERTQVQRHDFPTADHTFSSSADQRAIETAVADWLAGGLASG